MKPSFRKTLVLLLSSTLLSACVPMASRTSSTAELVCPPSPERILSERAMLRYHACLASLSMHEQGADRLGEEYAAVERHFGRTHNGADRLKLAMLLSLPDARFYSPAAALKVLGPSPHDSSRIPAELRDLAQFLASTVTRQQMQDDRARTLAKDLATEKQHAGTLRARIDSVKNLERAMTQREEQ